MEKERFDNKEVTEASAQKDAEKALQDDAAHQGHEDSLNSIDSFDGDTDKQDTPYDPEKRATETASEEKNKDPHETHAQMLESINNIQGEERADKNSEIRTDKKTDTVVDSHQEHADRLSSIGSIGDDFEEPKDKPSINDTNPDGSPKRFEDYTYTELLDMARDNPELVTKLNEDFRERYEAETRDMSQNEYREYKIEGTLQKFSCINFPAEESYNNFAKENCSDINDLKHKNVYDIRPMGITPTPEERMPTGTYTKKEIMHLKEVRDNIDAPAIDTVMQKVVCVDTGNINEDLKHYLSPKNQKGEKTDCQVFGFVAKAEDVAAYTNTPQECYNNLRLDYDPGENKINPYNDPNKSVYVIRFTDGENYDIPYSKEFGGTHSEGQPFTGNGFVAAKDVVIPEYKVRKDEKDRGAVVSDGIIYRINSNGIEEPVAFFNKYDKCFELIKKGA